MRGTKLLIVVLAGLLAMPAAAVAAVTELGDPGHNPPTRKLEAAFTASLSARVNSEDGCYPEAEELAAAIQAATGSATAVVDEPEQAAQEDVVYVLTSTECNSARAALRFGPDIYVLDSAAGEIAILGETGFDAAAATNAGPLRDITVSSESFPLDTPNRRIRFDTNCPSGTLPLGGGFFSTPGLGRDGEGTYPHSFERLGAQLGFHVTAWLADPSGGEPASREVTLQAVCGRGLAPMSSPHTTVFVKPGESESTTATCPEAQYLMSGGFQRTDFLADGGDYVTESRADGPSAWKVSGAAHGDYGGELTAIAYCVEAPAPLINEVSSSVPVPEGGAATATTPSCPIGSRLTFGGFSANGSDDTFFSSGTINEDGSWSATSYAYFGGADELTAYGYCLDVPGLARSLGYTRVPTLWTGLEFIRT